MLNTVVSPSLTTSPLSPMGPSAGARNATIITSRLPLSFVTVVFTESSVSTNFVNPSFSSSRRRSGTG